MNICNTQESWEQALQESMNQPVILLKHSTACPISAKGHQRVMQGYEQDVLTAPLYTMIVQDAPELKLVVAQELGVEHQSPQVIVLHKGKAVYNSSHMDIDAGQIASEISNITS